MILSEHALKGNGEKLIKACLSTLESATSWLDIRMRLAVESPTDTSARNSLIFSNLSQFNIFWGFSVTLPVSYSFACHVS